MSKIMKLRSTTKDENNMFVYEGFFDTMTGDFIIGKKEPKDNPETGFGHKRFVSKFKVLPKDQYGFSRGTIFCDTMDGVIKEAKRLHYSKIYVK